MLPDLLICFIQLINILIFLIFKAFSGSNKSAMIFNMSVSYTILFSPYKFFWSWVVRLLLSLAIQLQNRIKTVLNNKKND